MRIIEHFMTKLSWKKSKKKRFIRYIMIKKRQKTVTVTVFEIFPFLGQNGWGTVRERSLISKKFPCYNSGNYKRGFSVSFIFILYCYCLHILELIA